MKANLKGLGGIKGLALRHGEKIVIAIIGLIALWFVYSSAQLPRLGDELQAEKLDGKIKSTNTAIDASTWPTAPDGEGKEDVREFKPIAKNAIPTVDAKHYAFRGLEPSVVGSTTLRGDPLVLNAAEVRAYGESGLLAFRDENTAAEQTRRQQLKAEEEQKKQEREAAQRAGNPDAVAARPGGQEGEFGNEVFDPEHPTRRLLPATSVQVGVPLQGGERLERVYWATIVAKVPVREQLKLFKDAFQNVRGYDAARDFPQYVGFQVQRREVADGKPTDWKVINVFDGQKKKAGNNVNGETVAELNRLASLEWAGPSLEPVDARWTDQMLTLPLPPLVGRNFGEDATHPDIPLAINAPPPEVPEVTVEGPAAKPAEGDDDGFSAGAAGQQRSGGGEVGPSMRQMPPGYGGAEYGPSLGGRRSMGPGGMESGYSRGRGGEGPMNMGGGIAAGQRTELPREVNDLLLRFFDYTVEAGKEYQYRVMVYIADPNNGIPLKSGYLESAVIDRRLKEIQTAKAANKTAPWARAAEKWSDPSPIAGIPFGGTVHVAEAKPSKTANDEPSIKMFAEAFDIEPADGSAIHVAQETEIRRGAVINLKGKMKYTGTSESGPWIDTKDEYAINTGLTVLDIEGGDDLGKKMTVPVRVLLMDGAGQLAVREELDDSTNVKNLRYEFSDKVRRSNQPGAEFAPEAMRRGPGREP